MSQGPTVVVVPSMAAAVELPRRLASSGRPLAGLYPFTLLGLATAVAEPTLLGRGLEAWTAGHAALLAAQFLEGPHGLRLDATLPRRRVAAALARTLSGLRMSGLEPERLEELAGGLAGTVSSEDVARVRGLAGLYRQYHEAVEGRFADPATVLKAAAGAVRDTPWLDGASVLVVDEPELEPVEKAFLVALAGDRPVRFVGRESPSGLGGSSFAGWAATQPGLESVRPDQSLFAPLETPSVPVGLGRLRGSLFEPPAGTACLDGSVELLSAPGEEAEVRSVVRRLLRAAGRGVPFEQMAVILPRANQYAPLFTDLLGRLGIPHRLHPSLPLSFGRCARSLLLLLRCRGLQRSAVMEFLTFAPIPFGPILGLGDQSPPLAVWEAISRDAGIVSGLERWIIGLRAFAENERAAAEKETSHRARRQQRAEQAESLLRVVELLSATLDALAGEAAWSRWVETLRGVLEDWIGEGEDREALAEVVDELVALGRVASQRVAGWTEVEAVLEARLEWSRVPMRPPSGGAVHVGAMDALAGVPFRLLAMPGLVEGGYPGVFRPDPFLLDSEREALRRAEPTQPLTARGRELASGPEQLSLFAPSTARQPSRAEPGSAPLGTTQDRLLEARRAFHRAVRQAEEKLVLSFPRADSRTGRERMPSLFFVAAASALAGEPVSARKLEQMVDEDDPAETPLDEAIDRSERDQLRVRRGGAEAVAAIATGSRFFRQSREANRRRWSPDLTVYDGWVAPGVDDGDDGSSSAVRERLDPVTMARPISASRLATYARCGFQYLLQYVLNLEPALEPEERKKLEPLERGSAFHDVAERFLRERRDRSELPVPDTPEMRQRLVALAEESLAGLVAGSPPRYTALWDRERARFRQAVLAWFTREQQKQGRAVPAHFEVGFGLARGTDTEEPHLPDPLEIDLGDGRTLRVSGKIDRIDRRPDGTLSLRDYKTGRAPKDDGGVFRGGRQLQIPFYILAAARLFPEQPVVEAFLDYVDGGRQVAVEPEVVRSAGFGRLLRGLVDAIAEGLFIQEPSSCDWCDYQAVCGPRPLLERRRRYKLADPRLQTVLGLRGIS